MNNSTKIQSVIQPQIIFENKLSKKPEAVIYFLGNTNQSQQKKEIAGIVDSHALGYQKTKIQDSDKRVIHFSGQNGPVWIVKNQKINSQGHYQALDESEYGFFRDQAGSIFSQIKNLDLSEVQIYFSRANEQIIRGTIIGFELSAYNFIQIYTNKKNKLPTLFLYGDKPIKKEAIQSSQQEAIAIQIARHLVNLPPNDVNPETVEQMAKKIKWPTTMKVQIWDHSRLEKEKMGLHLAVGAAAVHPARMIHFRYRPKKANSKKPIAFVGKGVTFDTGGLDIKPASAMRLMKKDMGGSAAVFALAYWAAHSSYHRACDFYLALAENAVDANSMRPSDIYTSRAGHTVEIDNTDAEGRLVLADVIDVAVTQKGKDEPEILIDVATLTGAIKVALGADVAGLFCNDDKLAEAITMCGQRVGEPNWRIPLVKKYFSGLSSNFADFKNSADGFGGAITAALFLEKFIRGKKWAHLDVYCWNDKPTGSLSFAGGSGQPVQTLIEWLKVM